jgi:hypothetical protein
LELRPLELKHKLSNQSSGKEDCNHRCCCSQDHEVFVCHEGDQASSACSHRHKKTIRIRRKKKLHRSHHHKMKNRIRIHRSSKDVECEKANRELFHHRIRKMERQSIHSLGLVLEQHRIHSLERCRNHIRQQMGVGYVKRLSELECGLIRNHKLTCFHKFRNRCYRLG